MKTLLLYVLTAIAEIGGCYLFALWLNKSGSLWWLVSAALSLILFAWLLTLHDAASGRVYAAYGGVYIGVSLLWLWGVDGIRPNGWDITGAVITLMGMVVIVCQPR